MKVHDENMQAIYQLWIDCFRKRSWTSYSDLYTWTVSIINYFNEKHEYDTKLEELDRLYYTPIEELQITYPDRFKGDVRGDWSIADLEYIIFRDGFQGVKLVESYSTEDDHLGSDKHKLHYTQILQFVAEFKKELAKVVIPIMLTKNIKLNIGFDMTDDVESPPMGGRF